MKWKDHDRWARKIGIAEEASREVNNLVDAVNTDEGLYIEFQQKKHDIISSLTDSDDVSGSKRTFNAVVAFHAGDHDESQRTTTDAKLLGQAKLKFLRSKGDDYVKAWHLHHYLDFLDENRGSSKTLLELLDQYRQEKHHPIHSQEIEEFLLIHEDELSSELNL